MNVKREECRQVLMRRMTPGPDHGAWQPLSTGGFTVVCASQLEASELIFMVGGQHFPRPAGLIHDDDHDEERYLEWLLKHHFKVVHLHGEAGPFDEEGICRKRRQVRFPTFIRGWVPGVTDLVQEGTPELIASALDFKWKGR
jgi:hypothetical protein